MSIMSYKKEEVENKVDVYKQRKKLEKKDNN